MPVTVARTDADYTTDWARLGDELREVSRFELRHLGPVMRHGNHRRSLDLSGRDKPVPALTIRVRADQERRFVGRQFRDDGGMIRRTLALRMEELSLIRSEDHPADGPG